MTEWEFHPVGTKRAGVESVGMNTSGVTIEMRGACPTVVYVIADDRAVTRAVARAGRQTTFVRDNHSGGGGCHGHLIGQGQMKVYQGTSGSSFFWKTFGRRCSPATLGNNSTVCKKRRPKSVTQNGFFVLVLKKVYVKKVNIQKCLVVRLPQFP